MTAKKLGYLHRVYPAGGDTVVLSSAFPTRENSQRESIFVGSRFECEAYLAVMGYTRSQVGDIYHLEDRQLENA